MTTYLFRGNEKGEILDLSAAAVRVPEPQMNTRQFDSDNYRFAWVDGWLSAMHALGVKP